MNVFDYTAVIWKESEAYVSKCPELGVASCGDTLQEAIENLKEAVQLYLENAVELGFMDDLKESLVAKDKFTTHLEATLP